MAAGMNMRCPKCGAEAAPGKRFCADCGAPLPIRCPNVAPRRKSANHSAPTAARDSRRFPGTSRNPAPPPSGVRVAAEAAEIPEGERKTVTALFADIKGSTELMRDLDPEEARAIVDPLLKLMMAAVHRYDGYVVQSTGDGHLRAVRSASRARGPSAARVARGAGDAGGVAPLCRPSAHGWQDSSRSARRGEHGRGGGADDRTGGHTEYTPVGH